MARPVEQRVRQGQQVDTRLPDIGVARAAQTTRALGSTRVEGWVANNNHSLLGLSALSRGLRDALGTVGAITNEMKQKDILGGQQAVTKGESFEDQKTRGQQEGFLRAEGRKAAGDSAIGLTTLFQTKTVELNGEIIEWDGKPESWDGVAQKYLKKSLKGLSSDPSSRYFLSGYNPAIEARLGVINSQVRQQSYKEIIVTRNDKTTKAYLSEFQAMQDAQNIEEAKPFTLKEVQESFKRIHEEAKKNNKLLGGTNAELAKIEATALQSAMAAAAANGDTKSIRMYYQMANTKRGKDINASLMESQYAGQLSQSFMSSMRSAIYTQEQQERDEEKALKDLQRERTARRIAEYRKAKAEGNTELLNQYRNENLPENVGFYGASGIRDLSRMYSEDSVREDSFTDSAEATDIKSSLAMNKITIEEARDRASGLIKTPYYSQVIAAITNVEMQSGPDITSDDSPWKSMLDRSTDAYIMEVLGPPPKKERKEAYKAYSMQRSRLENQAYSSFYDIQEEVLKENWSTLGYNDKISKMDEILKGVGFALRVPEKTVNKLFEKSDPVPVKVSPEMTEWEIVNARDDYAEYIADQVENGGPRINYPVYENDTLGASHSAPVNWNFQEIRKYPDNIQADVLSVLKSREVVSWQEATKKAREEHMRKQIEFRREAEEGPVTEQDIANKIQEIWENSYLAPAVEYVTEGLVDYWERSIQPID